MIAVRRIVERAGLVDDADRGFVRGDSYALDVVQSIFDERMQGDRRFHRGLRVEFRRERNLEQHVLHDIGGKRPRELDWITLEQHVAETPRSSPRARRDNPSRLSAPSWRA